MRRSRSGSILLPLPGGWKPPLWVVVGSVSLLPLDQMPRWAAFASASAAAKRRFISAA
jgi:hypothetical protein